MNSVVLDASALLAALYSEPGRVDAVKPYQADAMILTVNLCEVLTSAHDRGIPLQESRRAISRFSFHVVPADEELACLAAEMRPLTRPHGLSLGDRFCLALAISKKRSVITTDSQWAKIDLGIKVVVIK